MIINYLLISTNDALAGIGRRWRLLEIKLWFEWRRVIIISAFPLRAFLRCLVGKRYKHCYLVMSINQSINQPERWSSLSALLPFFPPLCGLRSSGKQTDCQMSKSNMPITKQKTGGRAVASHVSTLFLQIIPNGDIHVLNLLIYRVYRKRLSYRPSTDNLQRAMDFLMRIARPEISVIYRITCFKVCLKILLSLILQ